MKDKWLEYLEGMLSNRTLKLFHKYKPNDTRCLTLPTK
jgi:hypothetical protein